MLTIPKIEIRLKAEPCIVNYDNYDIVLYEDKTKNKIKIKFGCYNVPREKIVRERLNEFTRLKALSTYISDHLQNRFARNRNLFIDYSKPLEVFKLPTEPIKLKFSIFKCFRLEWYVTDRSKFLLHIIPKYEFLLEPRLDIILKATIEKRMDLTFLKDVSLSTEKEYWMKGLGPKDAGVFDSICTKTSDTRICDYYKTLDSIKRYFVDKSVRKNSPEIKEYFENKLKEDNEPIIVRTRRLWKGEERTQTYIASMLYITPSFESLDNLFEFIPEDLKSNYFNSLHRIMRPDNAKEYLERLNELKNEIIKIFSQIRFIKVEGE